VIANIPLFTTDLEVNDFDIASFEIWFESVLDLIGLYWTRTFSFSSFWRPSFLLGVDLFSLTPRSVSNNFGIVSWLESRFEQWGEWILLTSLPVSSLAIWESLNGFYLGMPRLFVLVWQQVKSSSYRKNIWRQSVSLVLVPKTKLFCNPPISSVLEWSFLLHQGLEAKG
jgi:hypothetical protein